MWDFNYDVVFKKKKMNNKTFYKNNKKIIHFKFIIFKITILSQTIV